MTKVTRIPAYKSAIVAATLAFVGGVAGCSTDQTPENWSAAVSDAKEKVASLQTEGQQLLEDAKNFSQSARASIEDATTSAQTSADEARAALEGLNQKRENAQVEAEAAHAKLEEAKAKLDELASKLNGDELAKVEAERDKIMGSLDDLISKLETAN